MKRRILTALTLVSALTLSGAALAESPATKAPVPPAASQEAQKTAKAAGPQLSPEKDRVLKDAMAKARADNEAVNEQIKAKRRDLASLLKAPSFDKAAFLAKQAEMQDLIGKMANARASALAEAAAQFSPEDRKILARRYDRKKSYRADKKPGEAKK